MWLLLLISRSDCDCGGVSLITSEVDDGVSMISTRARLMLIEGDFCRPMALSALRFLEPLKKDVIFIVGVVVKCKRSKESDYKTNMETNYTT